MATAAQQQAFVQTYGPYATQAGNTLGVDPSVVLGQWAQESGWGVGGGAANQGNMAGITTTGGGYASYATPQDFTNAYITTLQNPRYSSALNTGSDSQAFVSGLYSGGYFTGNPTTYSNNVASNASTIGTIGNGGALANNQPMYYEGFGSNGNFIGSTTDTSQYPVSGATTYQPVYSGSSSTTGGSTTGTAGNAATTAGSLGADVGYLPPAQTGGPQATGLAPGVVASISSWISNIEGAVGTAFRGFGTTLFGDWENWFTRGFLILVGLGILVVALWALVGPSPETMMRAAELAA